MKLRRLLATLASTLTTTIAIPAFAALELLGTSKTPVRITPPASSGLNEVLVIPSVDGVTARFSSANSGTTVKWYRFSSLGGGYAEEVPSSQSGTVSTLAKLEGDMGYIVEQGTDRYYYWITDYSRHRLTLDGLNLSPESDCSTALLDVDGYGDRIDYYTINGARQALDRGLELTYQTLVWDDKALNYRQETATETIASFSSTVHCDAPLCDSEFTLSGDAFLRAWDEEISVTTPSYPAYAVAATAVATQVERDTSNEIKSGSSGLGGSAPCEVTFSASVTDAAIFREWQISDDPEFENISLRFNDLEVTHTFRDEGTTYVRFMAANDDGTCEYYSDTYEITIGESQLKCPNAFSPGASEGVNDEWRVSYRSITSFDCQIFNRWGQLMAKLTEPSQGWDGRYHGKFVPSGVYFYVIKATGADGKEYKMSGDINIINYRTTASGNSSSETTTK